MSGFSFATPAAGGKPGFSFGTTPAAGVAPTQASASFSLGATQPPAATQPANASFTLGGAAAAKAPTLGFSLGGAPTAKTAAVMPQQPATGGLTLGQPATGGLNLGQPATGGLNLGQPATGGLNLGQTPAATGGLNLGQTAAAAGGLSLGGGLAQKPTLTLGGTTTASTGFSLGGAPPANASTLTLGGATTMAGGLTLGATTKPLTLGGATTQAATTGFSLGGATSSSGLTLGAPAAATTAALTLGATPASTAGGLTMGGGLGGTAATPKTGISYGTPATTAATGGLFGGLGGALPAATSSAPGLFGSTTSSAPAPSTGVFGVTTATVPASTGLGGVDPKTSGAGTGTGGATGKPGDTKAVKETPVINEINSTVQQFKDYVKKQKAEREKILRMSSTPMYRVQEEVANLKQLLSHVSNSLQRNAVTIDKLKHDTAMELKHAEIAHRTKETPPGLQYEHIAPTEYFSRLVDGFETQMVFYRQQIEEMENYLTSLNQGTLLTPQELSMLLAKLHETFIGLASQLRAVHEEVKIQKDYYLTYRRVYHGDTADVFEKRKAARDATGSSVVVTVGPTPFTGLSNTAATAMASSLTRTQPVTGLALGGTGFGAGQPLGSMPAANTGTTGGLFGAPAAATSLGRGTGFGASSTLGFGQTATTQASTGFGASTGFNLSTATNTATVKPLGSTTGTGLFGSASAGTQNTGGGFGSLNQTAPVGGGFGTQAPATAGGFGNTTAFGTQNANGNFQLQSPPLGTKRGKKN